MKATIFIVALVVVLCTTAFGCDHMGYRRDAGRCKTKHETNLQQASASQRCCAFYVLSECLKLASRYSDCPQTYAMAELKELRDASRLTPDQCQGGREQCGDAQKRQY
ncbi:uncharacterized protein LOC119378824 [Rhipicephalus sanguineus]|uniref:uncharacterized protein LOC119378824 n=1 Tax=Rhipicephalus sanguineus TaxID=34632 RepID=UPI0018950BCE|nr:uncharacterized protein LOC119378824 [Rhipicephalus sanguineus]